MTIYATVRRIELEGGIWGLEAEDGAKYRPTEPLPEAVCKDGQRVEATVEPVQVMGIAQWGKAVRVAAIRAL